MRKLMIGTCAAVLMASSAGAATDTPAPSPLSGWALSSNDFSTVVFANLGRDVTAIYRICSYDGAAIRVSASVVEGAPMVLTKGRCIDVATRGSLRLTRAEVSNEPASGTYQFLSAVPTARASDKSS